MSDCGGGDFGDSGDCGGGSSNTHDNSGYDAAMTTHNAHNAGKYSIKF